MSNNEGYKNIPKQVIDMLVDTTLNKHGAKMDAEKLDPEEKERIKNLVVNLKKSVDDLTQAQKEKEKQNQKEEKD